MGTDAKPLLDAITSTGRFLNIIMDVANTCNIRCRFCRMAYAEHRPSPAIHLTPNEFHEIVAPALPRASFIQLSCGGEPTTNPRFVDILRALESFPGRINFSTNGMLLSDAVIKAVAELDRCEVAVSIDGCRSDTVERLREGVVFDRIIERVKALARASAEAGARNTAITAAYTITAHNVDEIAPFVPLAKDAGFNWVHFRLIGWDQWIDQAEWAAMEIVDFSTLKEQLDKASELAKSLGLGVFIPDVPSADAGVSCPAEEPGGSPYCRWPYDHIYYDIINTGRRRRYLPCPAWPDSMDAPVDETNMLEAFFGGYLDECRALLAEEETAPSWCRACPMRQGRI